MIRGGSVSFRWLDIYRHSGESRNLAAPLDSGFRRRDGLSAKPPQTKRCLAARAYPLWVSPLPQPAAPGKHQDNHHPIPREPPTCVPWRHRIAAFQPQPAPDARHRAYQPGSAHPPSLIAAPAPSPNRPAPERRRRRGKVGNVAGGNRNGARHSFAPVRVLL